jgi:hypothetical protein
VRGGHNGWLFLASAGAPAALYLGGDSRNWARTWISTDSNDPRYIHKHLNLLDDFRKRARAPDPVIKNEGF